MTSKLFSKSIIKIKTVVFAVFTFAVACQLLFNTSLVSAMGSFDGYVINTYHNPQWDFTSKNNCASYTVSKWIDEEPYVNSSGSTKGSYCYFIRRSNGANISVNKGNVLIVQMLAQYGTITTASGFNSSDLVRYNNFMNTIGYEVDSDSFFPSTAITIYLYADKDYTGIVKFPFSLDLQTGGTITISNITIYQPGADLLYKINNNTSDIKSLLQEIKQQSSNAGVIDAINDQTEQQQQNREDDKQAFDGAQSDATANGGQSSDDAGAAGQTLLQAFSSFIGAITSATPSNCNLPMDTGFINFGTVNLCALSPPPAFQAISSIVVIGFAVPLSLAAAKKMIELFRSFQA